jgi:hypothetical protein
LKTRGGDKKQYILSEAELLGGLWWAMATPPKKKTNFFILGKYENTPDIFNILQMYLLLQRQIIII